MQKYHVYKNGIQDGPFSKQELELVRIYANTLIWQEGDSDWREASTFSELSDILSQEAPPLPTHKIGYDQVEDIAKVNYRYAIVVAGVYAGINLFYAQHAYGSFFGILLQLILPILCWRYFKKFFLEYGDRYTAKFINWIYASYFFFYATFIYTAATDWVGSAANSGIEYLLNIIFTVADPSHEQQTAYLEELSWMLMILIFLLVSTFVFIWVAGFRVMKASKNYDFPLKRIAISTMVCLPIYMLYMVTAAMDTSMEPSENFFINLIGMLPFIFLFIHFYQAETLDATP